MGASGRNDAIAEIAAILAAGYLRLLTSRDKLVSQAELQPQYSVLSPCYVRPPGA